MNENGCESTSAPTQLRQDAPQPVSPNPFRQVQINKVANGFILNIGCQTFVAKTWSEASEGLADYYRDPVAAEKKYCAA